MFLNSAVNIIRENFRIRNLVEYDIAKDIFEISYTYPKVNHLDIVGEVMTPASKNFFKLYPVTDRIFSENLDIRHQLLKYYRLGFMHNKLEKTLIKSETIFFKEPKYSSKNLIKTRLLYDLYILDEHILQIILKNDKNLEKIPRFIMKADRE